MRAGDDQSDDHRGEREHGLQLAPLERKPGALRNGAPFKDWNLPASMSGLRERLAKHLDGDREFVEVLSMVAIYGLEAVSEAAAVALDEQVATSAHVVNLLHRAVPSARTPVLQVPEALKIASSRPPTAIATTGC